MEGLQALLAEDVRAISDAAGEFASALQPIVGRDKVIRHWVSLSRKVRPTSAHVEVLNGLPAVVLEFGGRPAVWAPRAILQCTLDAAGRIERTYLVAATRKLSALRAP